ncbi:hypothetical protein C0992_013182 [Termitomyces sp. T32_za158]|nr:hypothetical protein C0992_013182 [Termitomyces sp. T32_za158]
MAPDSRAQIEEGSIKRGISSVMQAEELKGSEYVKETYLTHDDFRKISWEDVELERAIKSRNGGESKSAIRDGKEEKIIWEAEGKAEVVMDLLCKQGIEAVGVSRRKWLQREPWAQLRNKALSHDTAEGSNWQPFVKEWEVEGRHDVLK